MIRISRVAMAVVSLAIAGAFALPAQAQYNDYIPPKLVHQGRTSQAIAGSGTVIVQVQVNQNGTHKAMRVIKSTNPGNNAAAMEIANTSTYRVATRNGKPTTAFYDFTLRFRGNRVAQSTSGSPSGGGGGDNGAIGRMIRTGNYSAARMAATAALANNPGDSTALQQLGTANFFLKDYPAAAAAFSKVNTITPMYAQVAAQAFALGSVQSQGNPTAAVDYAKRAVALSSNANSYYALGVAELNAKQAQQAAVDLKKAHDLAFADSKTPMSVKSNIDGYLITAYTSSGDTANAQAIASELKSIDPNSTTSSRIMGNQYLQQASQAAQAGKHDEALAGFEKAAQVGDKDVQVTAYTGAAFQESAVQQSSKNPDYTKMKGYADKALAIKPDDPQANFAEGIALAGQWATGGGRDASLKSKAMDALNKAKSLAQAANNTGLVLQIDNFVKSTFK